MLFCDTIQLGLYEINLFLDNIPTVILPSICAISSIKPIDLSLNIAVPHSSDNENWSGGITECK